jgi:AraC-like DNA-binding protein
MGHDQGTEGMGPPEHLGEYTTLIVRIQQDDAGRLNGVVERARTGEKVRPRDPEPRRHLAALEHRRRELTTMTTRGTNSGSPALSGSRLRRVAEYIQQNLDKDLSLAELAAVAYMSPYHFARLFKDSTGVPPHRFVVRQRIARARGVLASPELSIAQVSRMVGFRTPSHFTTVFRRVLGITPGAYRTAALRASGEDGG